MYAKGVHPRNTHTHMLSLTGKKFFVKPARSLEASGAARDGPRMLGDGLERSSGDAARSPRGYVVSVCFVLFLFTVFVFLWFYVTKMVISIVSDSIEGW